MNNIQDKELDNLVRDCCSVVPRPKSLIRQRITEYATKAYEKGREEAERERWEQSCKGCGHHDTFWKTIVTSEEWEAWEEQQMKNPTRDVDECRELGIISINHWKEFVEFIKALKELKQ